jgi:hypothetical protein
VGITKLKQLEGNKNRKKKEKKEKRKYKPKKEEKLGNVPKCTKQTHMLSLEDLWLKFFAFFGGLGGIFMSLAFIYSLHVYIPSLCDGGLHIFSPTQLLSSQGTTLGHRKGRGINYCIFRKEFMKFIQT